MLCGIWNGFLVAILGIQPIIATLVLMVAAAALPNWSLRVRSSLSPTRDDLHRQRHRLRPANADRDLIVFGLLVTLLVRRTALGLLIEAIGVTGKPASWRRAHDGLADRVLLARRPLRLRLPGSSSPRYQGRGCQQRRALARARRHPGRGGGWQFSARRAFQHSRSLLGAVIIQSVNTAF